MTGSDMFPRQVSPFAGLEDAHSRLQELERLLDIKSAEAAQLKSRMQQLDEGEAAALRDQLREANRDMQKWREKAEAAEKKARMFQKFTTRVRSIHGSLVTDGSRQSGDELCDEVVSVSGRRHRDSEGSYQIHRVRFSKSIEAMGREAGGVSDNGGVIPEEVHDTQSKDELPVGASDLYGMDGVMSPRGGGKLDFGPAAIELWIAAQELLLEEAEEEDGEDEHVV